MCVCDCVRITTADRTETLGLLTLEGGFSKYIHTQHNHYYLSRQEARDRDSDVARTQQCKSAREDASAREETTFKARVQRCGRRRLIFAYHI